MSDPLHNPSDVPDHVLASVRRELAGHVEVEDTQLVHDLAAAVAEALAEEAPEHHGPEARYGYTRWLRERAKALRGRQPWTRWVLTSSG